MFKLLRDRQLFVFEELRPCLASIQVELKPLEENFLITLSSFFIKGLNSMFLLLLAFFAVGLVCSAIASFIIKLMMSVEIGQVDVNVSYFILNVKECIHREYKGASLTFARVCKDITS